MKNLLLRITAFTLVSLMFFSCDDETAELEINNEEQIETLPIENFISSFEQVISGPFPWNWEFKHVYFGNKVTSTEVKQALLGDFGQKSALKYSHKFDSNGNIEYSTIEEGPVWNGANFYTYELDEEGFIKTIFVKDAPNGRNWRKWVYTYNEDKKIISKYDEYIGWATLSTNTQTFTWDENGHIVKWHVETEFDNSVSETRFSFNEQGQVIKVDETEISYNNSGYISSINNTNYEYASDELIIGDPNGSHEVFGKNMKFKYRKSFRNKDGVLDYIIEELPENGENYVAEERYFVEEGGQLILKGSSKLNWGPNQFNVCCIIDEKRIYDADGDFIYTYKRVGNGVIWSTSNGDALMNLSSIPEWTKNLASFNSRFSNEIYLFDAKSYNN